MVPVAPVYEKDLKKGKKSHLAGIEPTIMGASGLHRYNCAILSVGMAVGAGVGGLVADLETFRDGCAIFYKAYPPGHKDAFFGLIRFNLWSREPGRFFPVLN